MKIVGYPMMMMKCGDCGCSFLFNYSDIHFCTDGANHVHCPLCNEMLMLPDTYEEIREKYEQNYGAMV